MHGKGVDNENVISGYLFYFETFKLAVFGDLNDVTGRVDLPILPDESVSAALSSLSSRAINFRFLLNI
jgi:hypothetical protein